MFTVIAAVLGTIPFLLGVLAVHKANLKSVDRYRQLLVPVVAVVYGIVIIVLLDGINGLIQTGLGLVARFIPFLGRVNTTFAEVCTFNCLFLLVFASVKRIFCSFVQALSKLYDRIGLPLFGRFYTFDDELGHWYLNDRHVGVRRLVRNLFVTVIGLAVVLFVLSRVLSGTELFRNVFYPAFAVVVLGEVYYFLSGITKQEFKAQISFEDDQFARIFQYAKLQEALKHYFGDRLLHVFSRGQRKASYLSHEDFCMQLMRSEDTHSRAVGAYFLSLVRKGLLGEGSPGHFDDLNHDDALNTLRLLEKKSVMYSTPFYRDYLPYVFFPVVARLMREGKVLVLYGSDESEDDLREYVANGITFVTNIDRMWDIGSLSGDGQDNPDVVLMPFSQLGDTKQVLANSAFFEQVDFVLVVDPSSLLATYQVGLSILAEHLSQGREPTYCIFDVNSDGLVDSLSHALRTNLVEVGATEYCEGMSVGMLWEADGDFLQHRLFPDVTHYLGVGTELGMVALKRQASKVSWAARSSVPLVDQRWIIGQYYGELFGFAGLPQEQNQVDEHFEFYPDLWSMPKEGNRFVVAEDESCNLLEAYRQFATRGTNQSFVNVIAPNYLLRDYMVGNAGMFAKDPKAVPSFAPDYSKGERNVIFSIAMMMIQGERDLPEAEVRSRLRYAGLLDERWIKDILNGMLVEYLDLDEDFDDMGEGPVVETEEQAYDPASRAIVTRRYYGIDRGAQYAGCFKSLRNVPLVTERPDGSELLLGSCLYGHVYQSFLPGQFLTLQGKYYEVVKISDETGVMLRRAADHFSRRRYSRQLRSYELSAWEEDGEPGSVRTLSGIRMGQGKAAIRVSTRGYLDMEDYGDFTSARRVELSNIPDRSYRNKSMLRIDLPAADPKVTTTIAVLMSEALRTLFPKDCQYLAVLVPCAEGLPEGLLYECASAPDDAAIYIVEDSLIDIGLLSSVERNVQRIFELCWDWLDWHEQMLVGIEEEEPVYELGEVPPPPALEKKKGPIGRLFGRVKKFFGRLFGRGKRKKGDDVDSGTDSAAPAPIDDVSDVPADDEGVFDGVADEEQPAEEPVETGSEVVEAVDEGSGEVVPTEGGPLSEQDAVETVGDDSYDDNPEVGDLVADEAVVEQVSTLTEFDEDGQGESNPEPNDEREAGERHAR